MVRLAAVSVTTCVVSPFTPTEEARRYLVEVRGRIEWVNHDRLGTDGETEEAGRLIAHLMRVEAADSDGQWLFEVYDCFTQDVHDAFTAVIDLGTNWIRPSVEELLDSPAYSRDLLFVDRMEILPAHRGRGVGLMAMRCLLDLYGRLSEFAVAVPYPMDSSTDGCVAGDDEWHAAMRYPDFETHKDTASAKLARYWQQVGFVPIPDSPWHVWQRLPDDLRVDQNDMDPPVVDA